MRKAALWAAAGVTAVAVHRCAAFVKAMSSVAPELRTPAMAAASIPYNRLALPLLRLAYSFRSQPGPGVTQTKHYVGDEGVPTLVLTPADSAAPRPAVLWLHGGGMVAGSAGIEAQPAGRLVRDIGVVVASPDYRLAPENPFPAALDDCMAVLHWMRQHCAALGIDPDRIAVCGMSSGGGLAAAVAQRAHDEGISLRAQALSYPMIGPRCATTMPAGAGWRGHRRPTGTHGPLIWGASRARRTLPSTPRRLGAPTSPGWRRRGSGSETSTFSTRRTSPMPRS
jgi:acetyl esterase/lipase